MIRLEDEFLFGKPCFLVLLLMEEILHHLGCIKHGEHWDQLPIKEGTYLIFHLKEGTYLRSHIFHMFVKNYCALQELGRNVSQTSDPQQSSSPASVVAQFRMKSPLVQMQPLRRMVWIQFHEISKHLDSFDMQNCGVATFFGGSKKRLIWWLFDPPRNTYRWIQVVGALMWRSWYSMNCSTSFNESCPHVHGKIGLWPNSLQQQFKRIYALQVYPCGVFSVPV